jgi:tol-pal system protein YbgF
MTRTNKSLWTPVLSLLVISLTLLASGCAAPQTSNELQKRIESLLLIQQQQARQLEQLQQQMAGLAVQTPDNLQSSQDSALTSPLDTTLIKQEPVPLPEPPSPTETAAISEAAALYLEAFAAIATGQMAEAEAGFKTFLQRFPDHEYAGNANYWMAEALIAQLKTKPAETILLNIIDNPKQQNKAPASMARLVNLYRETGAQNKANAMLQMLSTSYPESPELKRLLRSTEPR